jgi:hypothetical protein
MSKLDESWQEYSWNRTEVWNEDAETGYLEGCNDFQKKAIEELEIQIRETSQIGDYNLGIIRGLERAIKNIKILKAK